MSSSPCDGCSAIFHDLGKFQTPWQEGLLASDFRTVLLEAAAAVSGSLSLPEERTTGRRQDSGVQLLQQFGRKGNVNPYVGTEGEQSGGPAVNLRAKLLSKHFSRPIGDGSADPYRPTPGEVARFLFPDRSTAGRDAAHSSTICPAQST